MALAKSNDCKICAFEDSKTKNYINCVLRACRCKSTTWRKHRRYKISVKSNWKYKNSSYHSFNVLFSLLICFMASSRLSTSVSLLPIRLMETVLSFFSLLPIARIMGTFFELCSLTL